MNVSPRLRSLLCAAMLIVLPMAMLWPLWSRPVCAGEDDVLYYYPLRKQVGESLARGQWPLSDPLTACGTPILADPQSAVFFPTTWLFAFLPVKLAYSLSLFSAFAVAGVGMWVYLRRLGLLRAAAGFGAVAFMFSGFLLAHRVHLSLLQTAAFLPWGLWCLERMRRETTYEAAEDTAEYTAPPLGAGWRSRLVGESIRFLGAVSAMVPVFALALLAGHWPTFIQMSLVWGAYFLFRVRPLGRGLLAAVVAAVIVAGLTAPQWTATLDLMRQATRAKIGYAVAGENSYFPLAAVLWLFPFLMGSRWPNLYPQTWWGPWHLCEMLGYVGLVTLVLAVATAWKLRRRQSALRQAQGQQSEVQDLKFEIDTRSLVRTWTWIILGALVFMLGYYLPTYRLIYAIPVLGWVRCPARMILAVDGGLAVLAAVGVHVLASGGASAEALRSAVLRGSRRTLPLVMVVSLIVLGAAAMLSSLVWPGRFPWPMNGGWRDVVLAILPTNPAVWIPLLLVVSTSLTVWFFLRRPAARGGALIVLLLADLFFVAGFLDVPGRGVVPPDPEVSPAADWLRANTPKGQPYRVWGLGDPYGRRQPELLLARTNTVHDIATISTYGPFVSPRYVHILGFRIYGDNPEWRRLIQSNYLLRWTGVRYLLAEKDSDFARVIESVRMGEDSKAAPGPNLLGEDWRLSNAERWDGEIALRAPWLWGMAEATQSVKVESGRGYRISLEARAPQGGAANFFQVGVVVGNGRNGYWPADENTLVVYPEQVGWGDWRRFERTFRLPDNFGRDATFCLLSLSERPIEVRGISLRRAEWPMVVPPDDGRDKPPVGMRVYEKRAEFAPVNPGDPPVVLYENILESSVRAKTSPISTSTHPAMEERRRWEDIGPEIPLGLEAPTGRGPSWWLRRASLPAGVVYVLFLTYVIFVPFREKTRET
jgi:hypothetical protein